MLVEIPPTVQGCPWVSEGGGAAPRQPLGKPHEHPPAALRLRYAPLSPFEAYKGRFFCCALVKQATDTSKPLPLAF